MGYTTSFNGEFTFNKPLTAAQVAYLTKFCRTRRMKRDAKKASKLPDPLREAVGLPIGDNAEYFVGGFGFMGQEDDDSVLDRNYPPPPQPGLWCQWAPSDDGASIAWDGGEKFYNYIEWIEYIIIHFLKPWGRKLSGEVTWEGESGDIGKIVIKNNKISVRRGRIVYDEAIDREKVSIPSRNR